MAPATKDKTKYAVVKFLSDDTYSEIPTIWLKVAEKEGKKTQCWWPPRNSNTPLLMANYSTPNCDTWVLYNVEIIKYSGNYLCIFISSI